MSPDCSLAFIKSFSKVKKECKRDDEKKNNQNR